MKFVVVVVVCMFVRFFVEFSLFVCVGGGGGVMQVLHKGERAEVFFQQVWISET